VDSSSGCSVYNDRFGLRGGVLQQQPEWTIGIGILFLTRQIAIVSQPSHPTLPARPTESPADSRRSQVDIEVVQLVLAVNLDDSRVDATVCITATQGAGLSRGLWLVERRTEGGVF
jgi:hypothetical protein